MNWKKIYKDNYFSNIDTKLRFFQIRLNLRSVATNVQPAEFDIIDGERFLRKTLTLLSQLAAPAQWIRVQVSNRKIVCSRFGSLTRQCIVVSLERHFTPILP